MKEKIKVVIADDQEIFRDGLEMVLRRHPELAMVGEAENGKELVALVAEHQPDVVLTDIVMPTMDGIQATKEITSQYPGTSVIGLSMFGDEAFVVDMIEAGAMGYLVKNADKKEIYEAVETVNKHQPYYCKATSLKLSLMISRERGKGKGDELHLNEKEIQIIQAICDEMSNQEMANLLFMSKRTVDGYRARILEKLSVKSAIGIVKYAIREGIYKI